MADGGKHINGALFWFGTSLDPATEWDGWTTCRAGITETLVTVNENYEIVPLLSDSWEQTDDSTWVMHIREGVTFHDGTPVDGEAVKAALDRAMELQERAVTAAKIESVEADGQSVIIKTSEPFGAFLANLSEPLYSIVKVSDDQDYANCPIATGPFMVTGFEVNEYIETVKYDGYWGGASDVDSMTIKMIDDNSTRALALQSGEMDLIQRANATDIEIFNNDDNYAVYETSGARQRVMVLNHTNEFLSDLNVRKALAYAVDYDALVAVLGGSASRAGAPYPSSAPYGYDDLDKQYYDVEAAAACLAEAGFEDTDGDGIVDKDGKPLSLTITYSTSDYSIMLEAVQAMERECGIDLQLNLVSDVSELQDPGEVDVVCTNWQVLSTGDPQWFLDSLYKSDSGNNYSGYSSEALDEICEKMTTTFDIEGRTALTIEAEKVLLEECASVWLVCDNNFVVASSKVENVTPYPIDYYFVDSNLSIAE